MNDLDVAGLMFGLAGIIFVLLYIGHVLEEIRDEIAGRVSVETTGADVPTGDPPAGDA